MTMGCHGSLRRKTQGGGHRGGRDSGQFMETSQEEFIERLSVCSNKRNEDILLFPTPFSLFFMFFLFLSYRQKEYSHFKDMFTKPLFYLNSETQQITFFG